MALVLLFRTLSRFRTLFTVFIGFKQVNLHWGEACHRFYIVTMLKHKMIVRAQSEMEFHREEKYYGKILQLGQFHIILV